MNNRKLDSVLISLDWDFANKSRRKKKNADLLFYYRFRLNQTKKKPFLLKKQILLYVLKAKKKCLTKLVSLSSQFFHTGKKSNTGLSNIN